MAKRRRKKIVHQNGTESDLERLFLQIWLSHYPTHRPVTQLKFHPSRLWKFDFCWPMKKVAVEVQGMGPGHVGLVAMTKDYDKLRAATLLNWKVVYLTCTHLLPRNEEHICSDIAKLLGIYKPLPPGYIPIHLRK